MTPITAKLAGPDIAPPRAERTVAPIAPAAPPLPTVVLASLAVHGLIALVLVGLPMPVCDLRGLDATWVSFDLESAPPPPPVALPDPVVAPPAPVEPEPVARRERPQPVEAPTPAPVAAPQPELAPPSIDDVFGEPPPPAAAMVAEGPGAFAVAPGELGGVPGGVPGGHGTSLVSTVRPAPTPDAGPSEADRRRARRGYVHAVEELVRAHTRYPRAAAREGLQGRVELALRIGNDGHVLAIRVASTSGHGILDDAALDAAREIDRVPAPPLVAALTASDEVRVGVVYLVR